MGSAVAKIFCWRRMSAAQPPGGAAAASDVDKDELSGGADGSAAAVRQTVVFDSIDLMETWVKESGWTCLLLVGNNAAGYTEEAFQVWASLARSRFSSLVQRQSLDLTLAYPTRSMGSQDATVSVRQLLESSPADTHIGAIHISCHSYSTRGSSVLS